MKTWKVLIELAGVGSSYVTVRATSERAARKLARDAWGGTVLLAVRL